LESTAERSPGRLLTHPAAGPRVEPVGRSVRAVREAAAAPHTSAYRWAMLAALWFTYFCFGMVNGSLAPLIIRIGEDLALSRSALGVVMGAWALVYIAAAMPLGTAIDRFGTRVCIAAGIFLIAVSGLTRAGAEGFWSLFLAVAVFGLGGPLISVGAPKVIAQWFSTGERGKAMGIYMTGPYLGTAFSFAAANSVFMPLFGDSWRLTLAALGSCAALAGCVWVLVARDPVNASSKSCTHAPAGAFAVFGDLLQVGMVRTVLVITLAVFMFSHGMMAWLPSILQARGLSATSAGLWASIPTLVGIASNLVIPRFATPERAIKILGALYCCLVIATLLMAFTSGAGLIAGLVLLGIARIIGTIVLLILMAAPRVGAENMGAAIGLYFTVGEIGGVLGPALMGAIADLAGSLVASVLALNVLAVFLLCMTVPLRRAGSGSSLARAAG
jgi:cyanate permease